MDNNNNRGTVIFGALLLAVGIIILLGQIFGSQFTGDTWPLVISGVGLIFFVAMLAAGRSYGALAIPGSIITMVGLILYVQNSYNLWETWAYAWGLIISAVGIGMFISGAWGRDPGLRRSGLNTAQTGFTLFVVFGVIFEFIFSLTSLRVDSGLFWPVLMIVTGLFMLVIRSFRLFRPQEEGIREDNNLFWPVVFIGLGLLWFMVRQGMIAPSQLYGLLSLWPILLIAAGINILIGRRYQWVNLLFGILVMAGVFYAVINGPALGLANATPWSVLGVNLSQGGDIEKWVSGSGNVVEETVEISDFRVVNLFAPGEMEIIQGSQPGLSIEAEDNLIPYIEVKQSGSELMIRIQEGIGITPTKSIHYALTVTDLTGIDMSGAASIQGKDLQQESLHVDLSGFGGLKLENLQANDLDVNLSGSGSMTADGKVEDLTVSISGLGGFNGENLQAENVEVSISGMGNAVVWATNNLSLQISGVGGVSYYGDPVVEQQTSGIGNVRDMGAK